MLESMMKNTIAEFIQSRGLTRYALSTKTNIPSNTIYRLSKNNHEMPSGDVLNKILNTFSDATLLDLLRHERDEEKNSND
jgi:transcriptional regulator with XRE-family HTH domain